MINMVILIGNLCGDPEVRQTQAGTSVASMTLATTEKYTHDGEKKEQTEFHRLVAWSKLADICGEYFQKGNRLYVSGKLQTRKWTDANGVEKYTTEIVCKEMKNLSPRNTQDSRQSSQEVPPCFGGGTGEDIPF